MVDMQRKIAESMDCVLDGRDIGSFVLPNAKFNISLLQTVKLEQKEDIKNLSKGVLPLILTIFIKKFYSAIITTVIEILLP
jgi:cytidylate kinase